MLIFAILISTTVSCKKEDSAQSMPHLIFAAILLLLPTHAPESNWDLQDLTKGKIS